MRVEGQGEFEETNLKEASKVSLWIDGQEVNAIILWLTQTDAELVIESDLQLREKQRASLMIASFLSLPMRVRGQYDNHISLRFVQPLHRSLIDVIMLEMPGAGIAEAIDAMEERAMPCEPLIDLGLREAA